MKRRSFLKGLAAAALAPMAAASALAKTDSPKPQVPLYDIQKPLDLKACKELREARFDMMRRAMERAHEEQKKRADSEAWDAISPEMQRERLKDLYISPEAMEDIRNWGVDQFDETTRREIFQSLSEQDKHDVLYNGHCAHLKVSQKLDREEINELGRKGPYHRYVSFPIEVDVPNRNCDILCWSEPGGAIMDNKRVLLADF